MDFLTENDIRSVAVATLGDRRTLLAVPNAAGVLHIWQFDRQNSKLVPPTGLADQRVPGEKHVAPGFAWIDLGDAREQLYLFYGSRPDGATTGPFPLTFYALPFYRVAYASLHAELARIRKLMDDAGNVLAGAIPT